ncbi:hypothetical protein [Paracoccus hibiscisoli]|uniref:Uncharacterized protein n=1 Tax=Paracoccus hibiscisoli TaxID=2023261 RepID=A0A4U0QLT7_9RHOB|nr:hypothetical protein [Paracoccus hibiscisoli]TJZ82022.1 hypothetical protein FA740_15805 [Paracoccus hibiscisoli]
MSRSGKDAKDDLRVATNSERLYKIGSFFFKATAGVLTDPSASTVLNETFDLIVTDPGVRRRDRFIMDLDERFTMLERAGMITVEDLRNNEEVSALLLRSIQAATRSSGARKLEALKEVVVRGVTSKEAASASHAQVMLTLVDRMTEHHIIALHFMTLPTRFYNPTRLMKYPASGERESFHYGQPVQDTPKGLTNPSEIRTLDGEFILYVEHDERVAFQVAEADLRALGLTEADYKIETYEVGKKTRKRKSSEVDRYVVSQLGLHLLSYMGITAGQPMPSEDPA